jgi:hypothetical protein
MFVLRKKFVSKSQTLAETGNVGNLGVYGTTDILASNTEQPSLNT